MFLKHFVYVNWGNIPNTEFELGPINLFSGGNGSGKTTAADAIQTIMTAAHENLFQFNPGQDETTQRGRGGKRVRTLASYVLGCDDGSYARMEPCDGYLAAVFHPTTGEPGEPFTAVVAVRAWLEQSGQHTVARQDEAQFFILPGVELNLGHIQREDKSGRYVLPLDQFQGLLATEFGARAVERYDTKKAYLRRLYAALRGQGAQVSEREAVAAARAFSRFMAYKPVSSINQFVADEILERKDLGETIRSIASQLKTIHGMEREAANLVAGIGLLNEAAGSTQLYIEDWVGLTSLDYSLARHGYKQRQREYLKLKQQQSALRQDSKDNQDALELAQQRQAQTHELLVSLEAQRQGIPALKQRDELERQQEAAAARLSGLGRELLLQDHALAGNRGQLRLLSEELADAELAVELRDLTDLATRGLVGEALREGRRGEVDLHALMQQDLSGDLSALEQHLEQARFAQSAHNRLCAHWQERDAAGRSRRDRLAQFHDERERRYAQLCEQQRGRTQEIERLARHQVSYPPAVQRALAALAARCPEAEARVLCDHVEVSDARWQSAIEGYLGGNRYGILVRPEYEAEAIRVLRALPGRDNSAKVIQGRKAALDAARVKLPTDSIVHILEFSHATARDYFTASYGSVLRVASDEELRQTARGLTEDGKGSGGYAMFRCDLADAELTFGAAARERALAAKQAELAELETERALANTRVQQAARLLSAVDALAVLSYADTMTALLALRRELNTLDSLLASLDLGEFRDLEQRLASLRREEAQWLADRDAANQRTGKLQTELHGLDRQIRQLADGQDAAENLMAEAERSLRALHADWPEFDPEARLVAADVAADSLNPERAQAERAELLKRLIQHERRLSGALDAHNQKCRPGDAIAYLAFEGQYDGALFRCITELACDIDRVANLLKNNLLVEKHTRLRELKASFNNAFVSHLCHAIYQSIKDGERQLDLLNKELEHHRFGADREGFRFGFDWVPEYKEYWSFFGEVTKNTSLGEDLSLMEVELSPKSAKVRAALMALLLDEDEHQALRELERIADYRNYHRYEIYKRVEGKADIPLSEYGTGSGGQLETPAYIIRSAAITSAFRFNEGQTHLRMVLVDEAFSKMDETRSREVIHYLTESLGLQLMFIMPTSKCGPFMDLISNEFVFAKVPSPPRGQLRTRVLVDRKICQKERIQELWAQHRRTVRHQAELDFMVEVLAE